MKWSTFVVILSIYGLTLCASSLSMNENDPLIVSTDKGKVRGLKLNVNSAGKVVDAWFGIPYAQPPTGSLRFKRPQEIGKWDEIYDASELPHSCYQIIDKVFENFIGSEMWNPNTALSENCLYLNVVAPHPRPRNATVMVWIYGGGFQQGTSTLDVYDHRYLVSEENVIVVSMQYRVSSLGFLYSGTDDAPGNVGLLDQHKALQWVQKNIHEFGGDPKKVCLFGESAGAASISFHLLSPLSRTLFNRAILESGTALVPWAYISEEEAISRTEKLAQKVGCPHDASKAYEMMECLRRIKAEVLVNTKCCELNILEFPFVPVAVDGEFLLEDPKISLQRGNFKEVDILMGSNSEEAFYFLLYGLNEILPKEENVTVSQKDYLNAVTKIFPKYNDSVQDIMDKYNKDSSDVISNRDALDKMAGDKSFICDSNDFADFYAEKVKNIYMYYFTHQRENDPWPRWTGVKHADEIQYVFGQPLNETAEYSEEEKAFSRRIMRYWANFARTGNPNPNPCFVEFLSGPWPRYDKINKMYYELNIKLPKIGKCLRFDECAFWKDLLPDV